MDAQLLLVALLISGGGGLAKGDVQAVSAAFPEGWDTKVLGFSGA